MALPTSPSGTQSVTPDRAYGVMTTGLLNDNQRRHLVAALHLLEADIERLRQHRGLPQHVRNALEDVTRRACGLLAAFGLPKAQPLSESREVQAVASIWAIRVDDLRVRRLRAYGPVHPELEARLHPLIDELHGSLQRLRKLGGPDEAPEGERQP
jgi:hypothetical protein